MPRISAAGERRLRLLPPLAMLILLAATVLFPVFAYAASDPPSSRQMDEQAELRFRMFAHWQVYLGDAPPPDAQWAEFDEQTQLQLADYKGTVWLKRQKLPAIPGRDPYLFLFRMRQVEVFIDGRSVFSFNMSNPTPYVNPNAMIHPVRMQADDEGKTMVLKLIWNKEKMPLYWHNLAERHTFIQLTINQEWPLLVYGTIFMLCGTASLAMFIRMPRERLYGWFTLLTYSAGIGITSLMLSWQWYTNIVVYIYYFRDILLPLGVLAFVGFYGEAMGKAYRRTNRFLLAVMAGYTLLTTIFAFADNLLFVDFVVKWLPYLMIGVFTVISYTLFRYVRANRSRETFWLGFGYVCLLIFGFLHVGFNYFSSAADFPEMWSPYILVVAQHGLSTGLLLFLFSLVMVMIGRISQVHRQLKQYARELTAKNEAMAVFDRLKDDFLRNTSHELRTPLHGIAGLTESLLGGAAGPVSEPMAGNLRLVQSSANRLLGLVNDILDLYRLKHRDVRLTIEDVHLRRTAEAVSASLAPLAQRKGLTVTVETDDPELIIQADAGRLEQVLYNLIGNAIRYTAEGTVTVSVKLLYDRGAIEVTSGGGANREALPESPDHAGKPDPTDQPQWVEVTVADTGSGIPEEQMQRLFEPFAAAENQMGGGTGLGLSITKRLVELHGGTVRVVSSSSAGTTVAFTLPAVRAAQTEHSLTAALSLAEADGLEAMSGESVKAVLPLDPALPPAQVPEHASSARRTVTAEAAKAGEDTEDLRPVILIADDEPINLQVLRHYLRPEAFRLIEAADGLEAVHALESAGRKPDLLLLDVMMPGMTGYDVCRRVREQYSPSELPIILLSARDRTIDLVQGFEAGANDYVTKPFSQGELMARVNIQLKLAEFHLSLEQLVALRTRELEEANQVLAGSVRETAQALTEVSVLEERNRIAHEMHDLVGHSLTAAIVQLEAAKKLAVRDLDNAMNRIDSAGEMVRKGLDEIRRTVRMLKDEDEAMDLTGALQELLRETAGNTGVQIHSRIDELPPMSGLMHRVVYHALMEGMTNGIRHGRCSAFDFELRHEDGLLLFKLISDGESYGNAKPGFGLSAMMERVHLLGGTVRIASGSHAQSGEDEGCILLLTLPLQGE